MFIFQWILERVPNYFLYLASDWPLAPKFISFRKYLKLNGGSFCWACAGMASTRAAKRAIM